MPIRAEHLSQGPLDPNRKSKHLGTVLVQSTNFLPIPISLLNLLLLVLGWCSAAHGQATPSAASNLTSPKTCLVPKPDGADVPGWADPKNSKQTTTAHIAKAAKNSTDVVTVSVTKPLPKCVADSANVDSKHPVLSDTGMKLGEGAKDANVGSANCLLVGIINADFTGCSPTGKASDKDQTARLREALPLSFAILNLVRWSVVDDKPSKQSNWYLFDRNAHSWGSWRVSDSLRVFGADKIAFLAVHFGIDDTCGISYTVKAKAGTAQNVANLQQLFSAITPLVAPGLKIAPLGNKEALKAQIAVSADSALANELARINLSAAIMNPGDSTLAPLTSPDPGVGVYGFATFQGLEKLPYDLTLSGTPTRKPRMVGKDETNRFAAILATVEAQERKPSNPAEPFLAIRTVPLTQQYRIPWSREDAPITCSAIPEPASKPADSSHLRYDLMPEQMPPEMPTQRKGQTHLFTLASWNPVPARSLDAFQGEQTPQPTKPKTKQDSGTPGLDAQSPDKSQDVYKSEQTYHNEGLYRWDVSLGVPVLTPKKTIFNASDSKVRKTSTSPVNVYAFFDFFPKKTDLTKPPKINVPTVSVGLPLGSQPFNRPVLGSSLAFNFFGIRVAPFAGVILLRELRPKTLALDSTATASQLKADLSSHRNVRFFLSVNFSLKDAASLITSGAKTASGSTDKTSSKSKDGGGSGTS